MSIHSTAMRTIRRSVMLAFFCLLVGSMSLVGMLIWAYLLDADFSARYRWCTQEAVAAFHDSWLAPARLRCFTGYSNSGSIRAQPRQRLRIQPIVFLAALPADPGCAQMHIPQYRIPFRHQHRLWVTFWTRPEIRCFVPTEIRIRHCFASM
jgi:hypothetical protein